MIFHMAMVMEFEINENIFIIFIRNRFWPSPSSPPQTQSIMATEASFVFVRIRTKYPV